MQSGTRPVGREGKKTVRVEPLRQIIRMFRGNGNGKPEPDKVLGCVIGISEPIQQLRKQLAMAAYFPGTTLIRGQTGTGKDLAAMAIHLLSDRYGEAFIEVNCAAIPGDLAENEFFGHVRGAFTGATTETQGLIAMANGGTLFLDEIGDLPIHMQAKLLRAIETGEVRRLGSREIENVDVRLLAATNKDLEAAMKTGQFREDLYYRIAQMEIIVPSLRHRIEDIPLLAEHFVREIAERMGREIDIGKEAFEALKMLRLGGNVRELRNLVERVAVRASMENRTLEYADFEPLAREMAGRITVSAERADEPGSTGTSRVKTMAGLKGLDDVGRRAVIVAALEEAGGNQTKAAGLLQISKTSMHRLIHDLGLHIEQSRIAARIRRLPGIAGAAEARKLTKEALVSDLKATHWFGEQLGTRRRLLGEIAGAYGIMPKDLKKFCTREGIDVEGLDNERRRNLILAAFKASQSPKAAARRLGLRNEEYLNRECTKLGISSQNQHLDGTDNLGTAEE